MREKVNKLDTKSEQAKELGIEVPGDGYWGNTSSKVCGAIGGAEGGNFTKNAVQSFEEMLTKKNK
ncbi:alpha/beta-type small acid-soluble spore protein [Clostridium folliculivorans]|uniref:Small, acid-soluble spore protein, alpha/beta type n=1 Tax=Clostridium folliculivorans TaxID=2886038 RepID=A0A9W5Y5B2_9CLOT|nr:alpha/beta-type small acid-soluble spore protein [Clostridium folliculivorans]GKU26768.1 hypothetical protein CFOLD11_35950 [Clostridium folliculivorans]GKU31362.1 hypothetical protein CFB3_34690 [Clostridium folliculivorans]